MGVYWGKKILLASQKNLMGGWGFYWGKKILLASQKNLMGVWGFIGARRFFWRARRILWGFGVLLGQEDSSGEPEESYGGLGFCWGKKILLASQKNFLRGLW